MHTIYCFIGPSRWRDPGRPRRPSSRAIVTFCRQLRDWERVESEPDMRPWNVESKLSKTINKIRRAFLNLLFVLSELAPESETLKSICFKLPTEIYRNICPESPVAAPHCSAAASSILFIAVFTCVCPEIVRLHTIATNLGHDKHIVSMSAFILSPIIRGPRARICRGSPVSSGLAVSLPQTSPPSLQRVRGQHPRIRTPGVSVSCDLQTASLFILLYTLPI